MTPMHFPLGTHAGPLWLSVWGGDLVGGGLVKLHSPFVVCPVQLACWLMHAGRRRPVIHPRHHHLQWAALDGCWPAFTVSCWLLAGLHSELLLTAAAGPRVRAGPTAVDVISSVWCACWVVAWEGLVVCSVCCHATAHGLGSALACDSVWLTLQRVSSRFCVVGAPALHARHTAII